jgi:methionyl-tRNA synthetase
VTVLAIMLEPFMPAKMAALRTSLGVGTSEGLGTLELAGRTVSKGEILFPKVDS